MIANFSVYSTKSHRVSKVQKCIFCSTNSIWEFMTDGLVLFATKPIPEDMTGTNILSMHIQVIAYLSSP